MRLSMLGHVQRLVRAKVETQHAIDSIERGVVQIWVGGVLQNDALHAVASTAILTELRARQASLNRDLEAYGVDVDVAV